MLARTVVHVLLVSLATLLGESEREGPHPVFYVMWVASFVLIIPTPTAVTCAVSVLCVTLVTGVR